jgi:hypothetical protein
METTHIFLVLQERDTVEEGEREKETRAKLKIIKETLCFPRFQLPVN